MKKYYFRTNAYMKPYNNKKWWIDSGIVRPITIEAETITEALTEFTTICNENYSIRISKNALKNKEILYIDDSTGNSRPVGYVLTAQTEFNNDYINWSTQYIELWVHIDILQNAFEGEI